jgi:hypothetical protein
MKRGFGCETLKLKSVVQWCRCLPSLFITGGIEMVPGWGNGPARDGIKILELIKERNSVLVRNYWNQHKEPS